MALITLHLTELLISPVNGNIDIESQYKVEAACLIVIVVMSLPLYLTRKQSIGTVKG